MIIDCHTHYIDYDSEMSEMLRNDLIRCHIDANWRFDRETYLWDTREADYAVVFGIRASKTGWLSSNERVAEFAKSTGGKYIFYASVDPLEPDFLDQLIHAHLTLGAAGVKLGPIYQGVHPHDPRYHIIYSYCQKHGLTILTHMATTFSQGVPLSYAQPMLMDEIACQYPGLKIILAHLGHPWIGETIAAVRKQPNLYADISALYYRPMQFYQAMLMVQEYKAANKLLFGSDYPATTTADSIAGVMRVNDVIQNTGLPPVSLSIMQEILYRDSLPILRQT